MLTVTFGLLSSLGYALGDLAIVKVVRQAAVLTALAWAMTVGLIVLLPIALLMEGMPSGHREWLAVGYGVVSGILGVAGMGCVYRGLVTGNLSVVAPLASLGGAVVALVAILLGESLPAAAYVGLVLAVAGCALASVQRLHPDDAASVTRHARPTAGAGWALFSVVFSAGAMLMFARAPALGPVALAAYGNLGAVLVLLPLALLVSGLKLSSTLVWRAGLSGLGEAVGLVCLTTALRLGPVAVATVFSSQIGTVAALLGLVVLEERPSRLNLAGVLLACLAATLIGTAG
jgi:drug/metabolite transporter (DMT)-like permease